MKVLTMGSPATTYIFNQKINEVYNGNYDVQKIREFYTLGHLLSKYKDIKKFADTMKDNKKLYDFLDWNFERGGFWGRLNEFQPDLLILDLFPEVYFGSIRLENGALVTRNFRLMKTKPKKSSLFYSQQSDYIDKVFEQVIAFKKKVFEVSPNTKLIFNGARFPKNMSKNNVIQRQFDKKKYRLPAKEIKRYNRIWTALDERLIQHGFRVLKFDQENNAAELNFPTGNNWYYLYNQNYYTDVQSQIEKIAQEYNLGPTILTIDAKEDLDISKINQDVVFLNTDNPRNDLKILKKDSHVRKIALTLAANDYILHGNKGSMIRFVKRKEFKTRFPKYKDVHYRVIPPKEEKKYWENRLLVRMFSYSLHNKTSTIERNFPEDFSTLKDSIVKNTYILEIGDINLIAGSFYTDTKNYPDYEEQLQDLIKFISKKYHINHNNIVLYGGSRGATGAILHAALGNYKFIVADPVIDSTPWYLDSDGHLVEGVRDIDLTSKVSAALKTYKRPKEDGIILATDNVGVTFSGHLRLPLNKATLLDLGLNVYKHPDINAKSVPIQLLYINSLLIKDTVHVITSKDDLSSGVVLEIKHLSRNAINFEEIRCFRVRLDDIENRDSAEYELAMENIKGKYQRVRTDEKFEYFEMI